MIEHLFATTAVDETDGLCDKFRAQIPQAVQRPVEKLGTDRPQARGEPVDERCGGFAPPGPRSPGRSRPRPRRRPPRSRPALALGGASASAASSSASAASASSAIAACAAASAAWSRRRLRPRRLRLGALGASSSASSSSGGSSSPSGATTSFSSTVDVGEEVDLDGVAADPLDRLHLELAPVDADLLLVPEPVGDVGRGHRAEERRRSGRRCVEAQLERLDPAGDRARLVDRLRLVAGPLGVALLELADECRASPTSARPRGRRKLRA